MKNSELFRLGVVAALLGVCGVISARADEFGVVHLFDKDYRLTRLDYQSQLVMPDAKRPSRTTRVNGITGATYIGNRRFLLTSNTQYLAPDYSYRNYVIEVELLSTPERVPTALVHRRTVLAGDVSTMGYDLDVRGVTVNTSEVGLGAGGNVVLSTGNNELRAFSMTTGAPLDLGEGPIPNGFSLSVFNTNTEDVAYVPDYGSFFTIWRNGESAVTTFNRTGNTGPAFYVGKKRHTNTRALPTGIALLPGYSDYPRLLDYHTGILVTTDFNGPGLELYTVESQPLRREALSSTLSPGVVVLPLDGGQTLQLSAVAAENETGRFLLFNRGNGPAGSTVVFVLTPIPVPCKADFNLDGFVDGFDFDDFIVAFETGAASADTTGDGYIDGFDYDTFMESFEVGC